MRSEHRTRTICCSTDWCPVALRLKTWAWNEGENDRMSFGKFTRSPNFVAVPLSKAPSCQPASVEQLISSQLMCVRDIWKGKQGFSWITFGIKGVLFYLTVSLPFGRCIACIKISLKSLSAFLNGAQHSLLLHHWSSIWLLTQPRQSA